ELPGETRFSPPPAVPDPDNFGAADFFKPLFDYSFDRFGKAIWKDNQARLALMTLSVTGDERKRWLKSTEPRASWGLQKATDLLAWQRFYQTNSIFSSRCSPGPPAPAVLKSLALFDPELKELEPLSYRTRCRFPVHYEEGYAAFCLQLSFLNNVAEVLALRAAAKLDLGDSHGARADMDFIFRLAHQLRSEPGKYAFHVRKCILLLVLQPLWEGLARQRWTSDELHSFEQKLPIPLLPAHQQAVQDDIASTIEFWNRFTLPDEDLIRRLGSFPASSAVAKIYPLGWKYLNQAALCRLQNEILAPMVDPRAGRIFPAAAAHLLEDVTRARVWMDPVSLTLVPFQADGLADALRSTAYCQAALHEAQIACALERWRKTKGFYPAALDRLKPEFLSETPRDPISGREYKYLLPSEQNFILYSLGWNETDNGGESAPGADLAEVDLTKGDWAWRYDP
ncbi:MAG TPA: hypothetical protein VK633_05350, partial [Verrucomicrobiae bacterium]|nr:hypothetical protein [Verrucomicrobiae bacterium]